MVLGDAAELVVLFVHYLSNDLLFTPGAVRFHLTNLRTVFILPCGHVALSDSSIMTMARRSLLSQSSLPDLVQITPPERRPEQLPFTIDMLDRLRERYWTPGNLTRKMLCIACITAYYPRATH